ncbi:MAG: 3-isopropylmalate dehydratase small subunit [Halomonas sp.]|nr:3-isopropylmalate dehydratase small subunit [Halomonas sp.]TVP49392.1 MAG: 3-isopropylmalate dehydratase small subunit [Halomonas sp.]
MQAFTTHQGIAVPLLDNNIDTDQIIPARFLHRPRNAGYADQLFCDLRFHVDGSADAHFILNQPDYAAGSILLAGENFGCGSSREHAVWALMDYGFRAVIAPSFGDIFFNNSLKNGLLVITLHHQTVQALAQEARQPESRHLSIDLEQQCISSTEQGDLAFEIDAYRKEALLKGASEIDMTLAKEGAITAFEEAYLKRHPWLIPSPPTTITTQ